ncbi:MAG: hypothetical protein ACE5FU_04970 [Nitrospinota bacterium]
MSIEKNVQNNKDKESQSEILSESGGQENLKEGTRPQRDKGARNSINRKQQWITDIIIVFLLISGACLLYQFNKQSERFEIMKKKNAESVGHPGKRPLD